MNSSYEAVGSAFSEPSLLKAQAKAWKALDTVAALLKPGATEKDALALLKETLHGFGVEKIWHPPQIRFGTNTTRPFGERGPLQTLRADDLFFLDIGPVFFGHESDVGRTYTIGHNADFERIAKEAREVFLEVRDIWTKEKISGKDLYARAKLAAKKRGWKLGLGGASGHRISDFPHAVHYRGKLKTQDYAPAPNRWILEIHLHDPDGRFGAFYEDIL